MTAEDQYMLMFSLGPVQPFIEQARKARDLWMGSLLLSSLMEDAMNDLRGEFIFPAKRWVRNAPDLPNKYVALFSSREQAEEAARQSKEQIKASWEVICTAVWRQVVAPYADNVTSAIWQRQVNFETLFEIYWAIAPSRGGKYTAWLDETEQLFAARKRLRNFQHPGKREMPGENEELGEPGKKSVSSGEREVLHTSSGDIRAFWKQVANGSASYSSKDIDQEGGEHLDAIDTVKRFAMMVRADKTGIHGLEAEKSFPSTSSIATASFVEQLLLRASDLPELTKWRQETFDPSLTSRSKKDMPFLLQLCRGDLRSEGLLLRDGNLYFPSTYTPRRFEKDYTTAQPQITASKGREALVKLLKAAETLKITLPMPYYGILQMDGDNMGFLFGNTEDQNEHGAISQALSDFVDQEVEPLVDKAYPARLVYAGGDDVLALASLARDTYGTKPPRTILELAYELQSRYQQKIQNIPQLSQKKASITASTGIVIAHHYTPLAYALRSARAAEKAAKKQYSKNALVVTLIRRSGEQTQVGCHWRYSAISLEEGQPLQLFARFYTLFKEETLSPKCVYALLEEVPGLVGLLEKAQASEIKRVLLRQIHQERKSPEEKLQLTEEIQKLAAHLARLANVMDAVGQEEHYRRTEKPFQMTTALHSIQRRYGLVECFGWLLVMVFLARKNLEKE